MDVVASQEVHTLLFRSFSEHRDRDLAQAQHLVDLSLERFLDLGAHGRLAPARLAACDQGLQSAIRGIDAALARRLGQIQEIGRRARNPLNLEP